MLLLLVRHAQAEEQSATKYPDDTVRPLVPKGKKVQARLSKELRRRKLIPDKVFSSPWKRPWLAALLLTGKADGLHVEYPKSGVMGIEVESLKGEGGSGTLRFFLTP